MQYSSPTSTYTNPYESPFPVEAPPLLYGRHEILLRIFRRLFYTSPPLSLQIIGLARSGKSSLLNTLTFLNDCDYSEYFKKEFALKPELLHNTLVIHVDCASLSIDESSHFWNLMDQQLRLAQSPSTDSLKTQRMGPITFDNFARNLFTKKNDRFIFLFDAFERVLQHGHIDITYNLRFLLEKGMGRIAYITATAQTLSHYYAERSDTTSMAALFSNFDPEPIYLSLLEKDGAKQFIEQPSRKNGVSFTQEDIEFVFHIAGQHPDLTRMLCKFLFDNYQLPFVQRAGYRELYAQLKNYFEPYYNMMKNEQLTPEQSSALIRFAHHSNIHDVPDKIQNQLIQLGLLIRTDDNHIYLFSEVLKDFLMQEITVGTSIKIEPQQVIGQSENVDTSSSTPLDLKVWEKQRSVQVGDKLVRLTPNEWKLFMYLWQHANKTCTRDELLAASKLSSTALDITISRLRKKVPDFIVTIHGQGYQFEGNTTITVMK